MTDAERKSFFAHSSARGPGKRQIKANVALLSMPILAADDDDDDDDDEFIVSAKEKDEVTDETDDTDLSVTDEEGTGSTAGDSGSEVMSIESGKAEVTERIQQKDPSEIANVNDGKNVSPLEKIPLICSLCLNLRPSVRKDVVLQCRRCGIAVHENCYLTDNVVSTNSHSSSAEDLWFCEPCLYGLKEPPYCEFCPSRFGAFKKADIGGGWVHLLCGLYTPGVTFGDVERLSAISWQEMDYKNFGKKACAACPDPVTARTGVTVACDAGLCKTFYHISCAQKLGLLVDNSESNNLTKKREYGSSGNSNNNDWYVTDEEIADTYFLTCRRHCVDDDAVHKRRVACSFFYKQEEMRMMNLNRRANTLGDREEKARLAALTRHRAAMKDLEGVTIAWPEDERKNVRYLHNSSKFLQLFMEKAEADGIEKSEFLGEFNKVDGSKLSYLPPAFSKEFISYFESREKSTIPGELEEQNRLKQEIDALRIKQKKLEADFLEAQKTSAKEQFDTILGTLNGWYSLLVRLGVKKIKNPEITIGLRQSAKQKRRVGRPSKLWITEPTPSSSLSSNIPSANSKQFSIPEIDIQINTCNTCQKSTDQHLLVYCDFCKKHFHLACLDPPLTKMPKLGKNHVWMCSNCGESDEEESSEFNTNEQEDGVSKPVLRDRSSMEERRRLEQQEQNQAFRRAMHARSVPWRRRKRSLPTPKKNELEQEVTKRSLMTPLSITVPENFDNQEHVGSLSPPGKKFRFQSCGSSLPNGFGSPINGMRRITAASPNLSLKVKSHARDDNSSHFRRHGSTVSPILNRSKLEGKQR